MVKKMMKYAKNIGIALIMMGLVVTPLMPSEAYADEETGTTEISEWFYNEKYGNTVNDVKAISDRMDAVQRKLDSYARYNYPNYPNPVVLVNCMILSRDPNGWLVKGVDLGFQTNAEYFIITNPREENVYLGGLSYTGEHKLAGHQVTYIQGYPNQVAILDEYKSNPYYYEMKAMVKELQDLKAQLKEAKKIADAEPPKIERVTEFNSGDYQYYNYDNCWFRVTDDGQKISGNGYMDWGDQLYYGSIENNLPNGMGWMNSARPVDESGVLPENNQISQNGAYVNGEFMKISDFAEANKADIVLQVGTPFIVKYGVLTYIYRESMDVCPVIKDGVTLVPARALVETAGGTVNYNAATQMVTLNLNETQIKMAMNQNVAVVEGQNVPLAVPTQAINGHTMIPLRFVSETLGMDVQWYEADRIIKIHYPQGYSPDVDYLGEL